MQDLHTLVITNDVITLDKFQLHGVTGYEVKANGSKSTAELTLKMVVSTADLKLLINKFGDNTDGDLGKGLE